ncbi:MAG: DUF3987 domain-containing protein [Bacteroidaceae bacterium]|nr:DUF3987 domain-containing protein [Bacteroidaceae bacterium]
MKLDIYENHKRVKPVTSVSSMGELEMWLGYHSKDIVPICQQMRETGDKSRKTDLPAIMPMGRVGDKTRKKENCTPTGLVMIDIDRAPSDSPKGGESHAECCDAFKEKVTKWVEAKKAELERLHVVLVYITCSGCGLRLLAQCHADGMQATIDRCADALELGQFGTVDEACTDLSRLSALVPSDYFIYENGLFSDPLPISIQAMKQYRSTGTMVKGTNVLTSEGEVLANDERYKDFEYNGFKVADIVTDYIATTGGDPADGTKHTFYNELIVMFRNLCNNDAKIVHAVLPTWGHPVAETWNQCVSLCSSNRSTKIDSKLYFWLKDRGMLAERNRMGNEEEAKAEPIPPMPTLPPIFRQYVNSAPEDFKVPTVVALLPILGTLTSHLRATYIDDSEQSTEFISLLFAPPSSGKSFIKRLSALLQNLRDRDEISNAREAIWAETQKTKGANDKGEEQPHVSVRIVKPLISIPELLTKMRDNKGHHMYIEAEELDTFTKGTKSAGGDKSDLWRVTWDNGFYGQYYKSVNTFKGEVQMFMNLLFTSTQDQIDRFFKNVEDGLVTRFSVCPIENQTFAKFVPWKPIPKKDKLQITNILSRLELKNYKLPLKFDRGDLVDASASDLDKLMAEQYDFQPFEHVDLSYIHKPLLNWLEEERIKSAETLNEARDVFRRRAAVKGFRLALLCHGLYANVTKREQQIITNFVKWFCTVDLRNSLYQFGERYNELQQNAKKSAVPQIEIFNKMGDEFTKDELRVVLQRAYIKTPVRMVIHLWHKNGLIEKTGNVYTKVKMKREK